MYLLLLIMTYQPVISYSKHIPAVFPSRQVQKNDNKRKSKKRRNKNTKDLMIQYYNECSFIKYINKRVHSNTLIPNKIMFEELINQLSYYMLFELANCDDRLLAMVEMKDYELADYKLNKNTKFSKIFIVKNDKKSYVLCYVDINNLQLNVLQPHDYSSFCGRYYKEMIKNKDFKLMFKSPLSEIVTYINSYVTIGRIKEDLLQSYDMQYDTVQTSALSCGRIII